MAHEGDLIIRTAGLSKRYGRVTAVDNLDLSLARGEIFGFLGLNGAGKTTTIRMLCGLLRPTAGRIYVDGEELRWPASSRHRRLIGYLPQGVRFHEPMSVEQTLAFYCALNEVDPAPALRRAAAFGLPSGRRAAQLSPGQQRKLGIILATLGEPALLFLDEPTAGLDPAGQKEMREIVVDLHGRGVTVFISSHILGEVQQVCTSIGVLHQGRLVRVGPLEERYEFEVEGWEEGRWQGRPPLRLLPGSNGSQRLLAGVARRQVPEVTAGLVAAGVRVYGIREQSLEDIFNRMVATEERR